ncbi:two-component system LytT family sensor kinase [Oxalobacteraceae bacterium GrIS 2.11]
MIHKVDLAQSSLGQGWSRLFLAIIFWTVIGTIFALPHLSPEANFRIELANSLSQWWSWGLLTPCIFAVEKRLSASGMTLWLKLIGHCVLGSFILLLNIFVSALLSAAMQLAPWSRLTDGTLLPDALHGILWSILIYCLILGVWSAHQNHQRFVAAQLDIGRLERNFAEARLNFLRMQLDPHFLFNALNTISAQVSADPKLARKMIEHLGDLLRLSLEPETRQQIPLSGELKFLDHYLSIQKIRFGERLSVSIDIAQDVRQAAVPSMIIQPLVENAIRHGLSSRALGGTILINAYREQEWLIIRIRDDGVGLPENWIFEQHARLGLSLTRERIEGLHPAGSSRFSISNHSAGGVEVTLAMPFITADNL